MKNLFLAMAKKFFIKNIVNRYKKPTPAKTKWLVGKNIKNNRESVIGMVNFFIFSKSS